MKVVDLKSWTEYREYLNRYFALDTRRRNQLWFRGVASRSHDLSPTLDRGVTWSNDTQRDNQYIQLLDEFALEAIRLGDSRIGNLSRGEALELIARHYGLPSPYLDWSSSPYIAATFAYLGCSKHKSRYIAIYVFDRANLPDELDVELIDDPDLLRFNPRALKQAGKFLRIGTSRERVEVLLNQSLTKIEVKKQDAVNAIGELDEMGLNASSLLADLEAAAATASMRHPLPKATS